MSKDKVMMNSPVGELPVRDNVVKENKNLSDQELIEKFYKDNQNSRFVDPELLAIIRDRGIYTDYLQYKENKKGE